MNKKNKIIMAVLIVVAVIMGVSITSYAVKTVNENKNATTTTESTTEPSTENTMEATTESTTAPTTAQTTQKTTVAPAVPNSAVATTEVTTEQTTVSTTAGRKYATMEQYNKIQKGVTTYEEACEIFGFEGTELGLPSGVEPEPGFTQYMWETGTGRFRIAFRDGVVGTGMFDKLINQ